MSATLTASTRHRRPRHRRPDGHRLAPTPGYRDDRRHRPVAWPIPSERSARLRAAAIAVVCTALAGWYVSWLLGGAHVGNPLLYGLLVGAEAFNLAQALGFWWTTSRQRVRPARAPAAPHTAVDVLIPTYDEPLDVVEPTVAAARRVRGTVRVWLLDDGDRPEMAGVARRHGAGYIARGQSSGAKAGNLNNALRCTSAPYVAVIDCDHLPRPDFVQRTLGHLEQFGVAYVQTPQYYANADHTPIAAAAAAQQSLFYGPISRGKDGLGAVLCCGTNVVFRRSALEEAGGFPEHSVTEDFELSLRLHERGWHSAYVPEVLACGLGPEDMASYVSQQQRWARGCLGAIPAILRSRLPLRTRLQYLLSATYFLSGWTLLIYMSLPVIRLLSGEQPLAGATADQFLLHFGPYYLGALSALALAGRGAYTYNAFALAAGSFWIHIQATVNAVLRRPARFVVTPKHGEVRRQPRAVIPTLAAIAILVGVAAYGLYQGRDAATLNNVAFACLHSLVLLTAAAPALRRRPVAPLLAHPPHRRRFGRRIAAPATDTRLPRPIAIGALTIALAAPIVVGIVGSRGLARQPSLPRPAHDAAERFLDRYVTDVGRVVRRDQGGDTVSEGQAYAMLLAVALNDRARFDAVWGWVGRELERDDGLLAYRWSRGERVSSEPASDADLDAARALILAAERFGDERYRSRGARLGRAVLEHETAEVSGLPVMAAGPWATGTPAVINPSHFSPRAYAAIAGTGNRRSWSEIAATSRDLIGDLVAGGSLPPDWANAIGLPAQGGELALQAHPLADPDDPLGLKGPDGAESGLDAARVTLRMAESCVPADRRLAAQTWRRYRDAPGLAAYSLDGSPGSAYGHAAGSLSGHRHAAGFVAAAAAADAAGNTRARVRLLNRAEALDEAHPTYYGGALIALARVMLTSSALGTCPNQPR